MANSIISSIAALNAQSSVSRASNNASASIARLSSGNRINKASDDVAGLATGTALRTQVTTLRQALSNASQGTSLLQVADGGLSQIVDILQRQKAIAVQASSGQLTDSNRSLLNQEFTNLTAEIDRIAQSTNFNGVKLLAGGLGLTSALSRTDATAAGSVIAATGATFSGTTSVASTVAIQAFSTATGVAALANATTIGNMIVTDSGGTLLANAQYLGVDASLYGKFSNFSFSNVTYGAVAAGSATLSATINGVTYTGTATGSASANASVTLSNGNTYIKVYTGALDFTNQGSTDNTRAAIANSFKDVTIARTGAVSGVDFQGTSLAGSIGTAAGVMTARLTNNGSININNFQYVSNTGAANTSLLTVQVNGETFTATAVLDVTAAANNIQFTSSDRSQSITINTTGLTTSTGNIRTSMADRNAFISALNQGVAKAGGNGLNFSIGSAATDTINVALTAAKTTNLYNGATLSIATAANATVASGVLDLALQSVVSLRASVGALQSRFNFASNAIQSALENQDSARSAILDTDVAAESSSYAASQVQLQAGISVLAQANQQMQNLLKLIS